MSKKFIAMAMAFAALASASEDRRFLDMHNSVPKLDPDWKRKKCKSCVHCGNNCSPYYYKGKRLSKHSKPTYQACENYKKRK